MEEQKLEEGTKPQLQHGAAATKALGVFARLTSNGNVEERGIVPVPLEERTNKRTYLIVLQTPNH